jgi:hypothetical protein
VVGLGADAVASQFQTELIPIEGTEVRNISEGIRFNRTGKFQLNLKYRSAAGGELRQCTLKPALSVACATNEHEVDGQCRQLEACDTANGFWEDSGAKDGLLRCRKRPLMAVQVASDRLAITHAKQPSNRMSNRTVEIRLLSGDVDASSIVEWVASSSSDWLRLGQSSGTVSSQNPVARVVVIADASGRNDTLASAPLRSQILVRSSIRGRSDIFENNTGGSTSNLAMTIELTVEATVVLTKADLQIQTRNGHELFDGSEVVAGDKLTVTARAFDYERLEIARAGMSILLSLDSQERVRTFELQYLRKNLYRGEVPSSWIDVPGRYTISVNATAGSAEVVSIALEVSSGSERVYVALGIAALPVALLVAFSFYVAKHRRQGKRLFVSLVSFEGLLAFEVRRHSTRTGLGDSELLSLCLPDAAECACRSHSSCGISCQESQRSFQQPIHFFVPLHNLACVLQ